jgi:hypothetical protein
MHWTKCLKIAKSSLDMQQANTNFHFREIYRNILALFTNILSDNMILKANAFYPLRNIIIAGNFYWLAESINRPHRSRLTELYKITRSCINQSKSEISTSFSGNKYN